MKKYCSLIFLILLSTNMVIIAQKENPTSDFEYDLTNDNAGVVIKKYKGERKDVVIPSEIEDFPVLYLDSASFSGTNVISVVIPDGVKWIGIDAFRECTSLKVITIGKSVQEIGEGAFYKCTSLKVITIGDSVKRIGKIAFGGCISLNAITIGDSVQEIGIEAFKECTSLASVTIGKGIKIICAGAFCNCSSLTTFDIGVESLTYEKKSNYASDVFKGCTAFSLKDRVRIKKTGYAGEF